MTTNSGIVSGVKWSTVSQFSRQAIQILTTLILASLLPPEDFGLYGMALVFYGFLLIFTDLGTSAAIIQHRETTDSLLSTVFWMNVGFGLLSSALLFISADMIGFFFAEPRVIPVLRLLALAFFISGLGILHKAMLERAIAFRKLATVEFFSTLAGALLAIYSAITGHGVWSLVYQAICVATINSGFLWWVNRWRPHLSFSIPDLKKIYAYSLNLTGFNILNYFIRNADYLIIGKFLGAADLGLYTLAYRIILFPIQNISGPINRVLFPFYARIQDDNPRFREVYLNTASAIALVTFPLMIGAGLLADIFVPIFLSSEWAPIIPLLQIMALIGLMQSIGSTVGCIYQAKGRTDTLLRWGICAGLIYIVSFLIGVRWGVIGVASAYLIANIMIAPPSFMIPFRFIELKLAELVKKLTPHLLCALLMAIILYIVKWFFPDHIGAYSLAVLVAIGITIYTIFSFLINKQNILYLLKALKQTGR